MNTAPAPEISMEMYSAAEWPRLAPAWSDLSADAARCSFFLTEPWIGTWLEVFGADLNASIVLFRAAGAPAGACLLARGARRPAMIPLRRISLNAAGEPAAASTYIEFNDLLAQPGWERAIAARLAKAVADEEWDEFALDGFIPGPAWEALKLAFSRLEIRETVRPCHYVDLAALRLRATPYEMALGRTTRKHLRQNLRAFSSLGELRVEAAGDLEAALDMFDQMSALNQRRWAGRRRSVFESAMFIAFHHRLIRKCFAAGAVQLLRVSAGARTVGIVYNLARAGRIYFYQCGFDYPEDKRLSPGPVTLSQVIQWCLDRGFDEFDFLSGDEAYKRQFSTASRTLVWTVFRRWRLRYRLLDLARAVRALAAAMWDISPARNKLD